MGSLAITFTGAPAGTSVSAVVTGPSGFTTVVTAATTLTGLAAGDYTVTGGEVRAANTSGDGDERFEAAPVATAVTSGQTSAAAVAYAYAGVNIDDPVGDAVAVLPTVIEYVYDLIELWTEIVGSNLAIHVEFKTGTVDFSESIVYVFLDVDRDISTGFLTLLEDYCSGLSAIGAEFAVYLDSEEYPAYLIDWATDADIMELTRTDSGSRSTVLVPLAAIGGSPRADFEAIAGNFDEPTDCLARGVVIDAVF